MTALHVDNFPLPEAEPASPTPTIRQRSKPKGPKPTHGMKPLKRAVQVLGKRAIDRRTTVGKALARATYPPKVEWMTVRHTRAALRNRLLAGDPTTVAHAIPLVERIHARGRPEGDCLLWIGGKRRGYPVYHPARGLMVAPHRVLSAYCHHQPIPGGTKRISDSSLGSPPAKQARRWLRR